MKLEPLFTAEFWAMGTHGFFVWTSYGFTAALLIALVVGCVAATRARERELAALEPERAARRRAEKQDAARQDAARQDAARQDAARRGEA